MPNGRLSKCVIPNRTPVEVYHNTSGNAASVSLFANTISTTTNTELTVVVGIASTTLEQETTLVSQSAGYFCSMTSFSYSYDYNYGADDTCSATYGRTQVGVSKTFMGVQKVPICIIGDSGMNNHCQDKYIDANVSNLFADSYGCETTRINAVGTNPNGWETFVCNCIGGETRCVMQMWGGNEMQNPAIWMRQLPASCNCKGYFWGGKVIGYFLNCCCACCWAPNTRCNGQAGTWHPIKAVNVGMGVSTNAAANANQLFTTWCCCCGKIGNNKMPIVSFSGCAACRNNDACCFGNVCHYQFCKMCACCCNCGAGHKMWNWYAQDKSFWCCCNDFNTGDWQCFKCKTPTAVNTAPCACWALIAEGELNSPLWLTFYRCHGQSEGCIRQGGIKTCWQVDSDSCGYNEWQETSELSISSSQQQAYYLYGNTEKYCHPCCTGNYLVNNWCTTESCKISPFGFVYGMTNCSFAYWNCLSSAGGTWYHRYQFSYPDACYQKRCANYDPCYFYQYQQLAIIPTDGTVGTVANEMPIKYWAWNCMGVTNKHGTCGCTYIMIRSFEPTHCGIFTFDAHDSRIYQGPFCGCSTAAHMCCGQLDGISGYAGRIWYPCDTERFTKVADWPTAMSNKKKYVNARGTMCMTCLYRTDLCNWTIQVYNFPDAKWEGFESSDLVNWTAITSPYTKKVSDTLTTAVTSDFACIIDSCNCFFGNIDCSGIIDYKLSIGQYERTGIVLSDGDRIMVNNDADIQTSFQVWGYEG